MWIIDIQSFWDAHFHNAMQMQSASKAQEA